MSWTLKIMYIFLFTTITGSLLTVAWRVIGSCLERVGFLNISYRFMQLVTFFWLVPVVYIVLDRWDDYTDRWGGDLLLGTPVLTAISRGFCLVWMVGVAITVFRYAVEWKKMVKIRQSAFPCDCFVNKIMSQNLQGLNLHRTVSVERSYMVDVPQVTGLVRPVILLPVMDYSEEELNVILAHELTHVRHEDILLKTLAMAVRAGHFLNPCAWWYCRMLNRWSEYACDYDVCKRHSCIKSYYRILLEMAQEQAGYDMVVSRIVESRHLLMERMEHVRMSYQKKAGSKVAAAFILAAVMAVSSSGVCFASVQTANAVRFLNMETAVEIEEEYVEPVYDEYVETVSDPEVEEIEGETEEMIANSGLRSFEWTIKKKTAYKTAAFQVTSGKKIAVTVFNPSGASIRFGIIRPNGTKQYISTSSSSTSHEFSAGTSGSYQVYVQNMSNSTITVSGSYTVI